MNCRQRDEYEAINVSVIRRLRTLILFALLLFTIAFPSYQASAVNFESNSNGLYVHPKRVKPNNNYAWTTDPGVEGFEGTTNNVVIANALKHYSNGLQQGYHYYAGTPEEIYIGEWENKVGSQTHACIHNKDGGTGLKFQDGSGYIGNQVDDNLNICEQQYNLPYWAHCSDCGGAIIANVYAKASTLQNINKVPNGSYYYYLCPYSIVDSSYDYTRGHMEQGTPFTHQCPKMQSVNRYKVRFNTNFDTGTESSGISVIEKWFYYTTSTSSVTYEGASIAFNSEASFPSSVSWTCKGYVFAGWKTSDGTVVSNFKQLLNWYKSKSPSTLNANENILDVYAIWNAASGTLEIDYNNGYKNSVNIKYNASYSVGTASNASYTVSFDANGGGFLNGGSTATSIRTFKNWQRVSTFRGQFDEVTNTYRNNVASNGFTTTLKAEYATSAVTLPSVSRNGYAFTGWYYGNTFVGYGGGSYVPSSNVILTAHWDANAVTLSASTNGNNSQATDLSWDYNNANWSTVYSLTKNGSEINVKETTSSPSTVT